MKKKTTTTFLLLFLTFSLFAEDITKKVNPDEMGEALMELMTKITKDKTIREKLKKQLKTASPEQKILVKEYFYKDKKSEINFLKQMIAIEEKYIALFNWPENNIVVYYKDNKDKLTLAECIIFSRMIPDIRQQILKGEFLKQKSSSRPKTKPIR